MCNIQKTLPNPILRSYLALAMVSLILVLSSNVRADHNVQRNNQGEVISGYDTVAYFLMGQAVKGLKDISVEWLGGKWLFVNDEHRDLFLADPGKYIPQYGGYCSVNTPFGRHYSADPEVWQIVDGKLYLFSSNGASEAWEVHYSSTLAANKKWEQAKAGLLQQ